jgi:hypothetical protein
MNASTTAFEPPRAQTRNDTLASGAVLASILLGVLSAALLA